MLPGDGGLALTVFITLIVHRRYWQEVYNWVWCRYWSCNSRMYLFLPLLRLGGQAGAAHGGGVHRCSRADAEQADVERDVDDPRRPHVCQTHWPALILPQDRFISDFMFCNRILHTRLDSSCSVKQLVISYIPKAKLVTLICKTIVLACALRF